MAAQKITVQARRLRGTAVLLPKGLQARILPQALRWQYIPGTSVSVPYFKIQFSGFPTPNPFNVMAERAGTFQANAAGYVLSLPLLKKQNSILITVVDLKGNFEDWTVTLTVSLSETAVYVDESCREYFFKIRELRRTSEANLIYLGCQAGSGPGDMAIELMWNALERVEYRGQTSSADDSIVTLPLQSKGDTVSEMTGVLRTGGRTVFQIQYQPYQAPPLEFWAGLAFFSNTFEQSNFAAKYSQLGTAFLGQAWFRPEDTRLSVMVRGFGTLFPFSQKLDPDQGYEESVSTYFVDAELRYQVVDTPYWKVAPFVGGWVFFQTVDSRNFGIQRIITPMLGVYVQRKAWKRDTVALTMRFSPLQSYFNPLAISLDQSYIEGELTYSRGLRKSNKIFATLYAGQLAYEPEGAARTSGSYLVLGGGYGW